MILNAKIRKKKNKWNEIIINNRFAPTCNMSTVCLWCLLFHNDGSKVHLLLIIHEVLKNVPKFSRHTSMHSNGPRTYVLVQLSPSICWGLLFFFLLKLSISSSFRIIVYLYISEPWNRRRTQSNQDIGLQGQYQGITLLGII